MLPKVHLTSQSRHVWLSVNDQTIMVIWVIKIFFVQFFCVFLPPLFNLFCLAAKSLQSCPIPCGPIDGSPPGSPIPGILQARTLEWGAIAFSISYARYLLFLSFIVPILAWNISLISPIFLKRSLVLLFFLCIVHLRRPYLSLEKAMAPHSSTLAWKIPRMEEPGRLQSMGSRRVGHDWATSLSLFTFMHWRRKWQPTPVFLPGESQGRRSLVGCCLWDRTESDMTEAT